jgi:hypothetical protein
MDFIRLLLGINGVFSDAIQKTHKTSGSIEYCGIENDRKNIKGDMNKVCSDIRKATNEARIKFVL